MNHPLALFRFCPRCGSSHFSINNEKSKKCEECNFVYYLNPSAAVAAFIVNENGELLVARRAKEPAKGTLDLPGGFTDMNENAEQALQREIKEETGIIMDNMRYLFSLPNQYLYSGFTVPTLDMFFECKIKNNIKISAMDDVEDLFFISLKQLDYQQFGLSSVRTGVCKYINEK